MNLGIVCAEFNYDLTRVMEERARAHAEFLGAKVSEVIYVPGCFDMPLAIRRLLNSKAVDGVVALGAVLEGETQHDEVVAQHAARKIMDLSLEFNKPVSLGIIGPGASRPQAISRLDGYAKRAVESAVKLNAVLKK
ncbi:MAG: 6,7-dimethyl-8-ribityllumazine synthase [Candidatus Micrarchaeia archaeon]